MVNKQIKPVLILLAWLFFMVGCDTDVWTPQGSLELVQLHHFDDVARTLLVFKIQNKGKSPIERLTAAIHFSTDKDDYYFTLSYDSVIPAEKLVYLDYWLNNRQHNELASADKVFIESVYYE